MFCEKCGAELEEGQAFCAKCGAQVEEKAEAKEEKAEKKPIEDKVMMILLAFFLGGLGVHNFMMGETKRGIAKILLSLACGIGWIFALIDLVKIANDDYVIDKEKFFQEKGRCRRHRPFFLLLPPPCAIIKQNTAFAAMGGQYARGNARGLYQLFL